MKKILYTLTALFALGAVSSCKKYIDVNTNPNAPTAVDASTLLPPIQAGMARGVWFDSRYTGQYSQTWASPAANNVWDQEGYAAASDAGGEMWRTVYFSLGQNVNLMIDDATKTNKIDYLGVAWALRAWGWQNGSDLYDYMIVKEAFEPTRTSFDYDNPAYVYAEVVKDCRIALNYLNLAIQNDGGIATSTTLAKGDYMYYGDRSKWKKFIYAILAQNMLHQSNKPSFNADLVTKYVDSSFTANIDNASVEAAGTQSGDSNFWGPTRANLPSFRQSDYIVRLLDGRIFTGAAAPSNTLDPRLPLLLSASKDGVYRGIVPPLGDPNVNDANTSIPTMAGATTANATASGKYIFNDNSRGVLMTYSELQFMKAEALFKKGDRAGAYAAYMNGVKGSLDFVSNPPIGKSLTGTQNYISATAQSTYLTGPAVRTAAALQLSDILQQKFISLFVWGSFEAWADERRYQYDTNIFQGFTKPSTLFPDNAGKQVYLFRPRYNSEYIWNVPALQAIGALNADYHTKQPWFILP